MSVNVPLLVALRYWRSKSGDRFGRLVTRLASIGIMLGVMALIIVLSVMNGLESYQKQNVLSHIPQAIVSPQQQTLSLQQQQLTKLPSFITKAVPINLAQVIMQSSNGLSAAQLIGVQQQQDDPLLASLPETIDTLLPANGFNLIIGSRLAQQNQLQVGDKVRLLIPENSVYTPLGRIPVQRLFTVAAIYPEWSMDEQIFANLQDVGRLLRIKPDQVQGERLFLQDPFLITELPDYFPSTEWKISDWRTQKGEFFQSVRMEKNMMSLLVGLIILVAIANIVTSLSLMVLDKQGEIAILQTQGLARKQIMQIFIYQGMVIGVLSTLLGAVLGILATKYLTPLLAWLNPQGFALPSEIDIPQILTIILFSLTLSFVSTLYPAYRAAKVEPAEALRYE
ncbi:permease [Gallibacterium genomosp. 3]|uniref:Permease n=1 Tax=Gallibacterium genomosp. 3 TaxID=505345 RepID=A0A1A7NVW2_9PAST|nr:lipoprotein-releasing ABC transporter permease subunit [Gallibacterium genomosp. 3]OBW93833.1 permease [Gallibacterium genomosp. 3]